MPVFRPEELTPLSGAHGVSKFHSARRDKLLGICKDLWEMWADEDNPDMMSDESKADIVLKIDEIADDENLKAFHAELKGAVIFAGGV